MIELNLEEFIHHFDTTPPYAWVHFEGRNIDNTVQQIDWLSSKAQQEGWSLKISVELEKPDRPDIDLLLAKVQ
jgi:ketohexokinase